MLKNFDYKVNRTENCVLIKTDEWISENTLQYYKISGKQVPTLINKVVDYNITNKKYKDFEKKVKKDSYILLSNIIRDIALYRSYPLEGHKYYDIPVMQILGIFEDNKISYSNLDILYDKVLFERVNPTKDSLFSTEFSNTVIGKVLKIGNTVTNIKLNDTILLRDNATTVITLNNKDYCIAEENSVVGIFDDFIDFEHLNLINNNIFLLENYKEKSASSSILLIPDIDYEELDVSDVYNRCIFKVIKKDKNLTKINVNDNIIVNRDLTNYAYFNSVKYFVLEGIKNIEGKII